MTDYLDNAAQLKTTGIVTQEVSKSDAVLTPIKHKYTG